MAQRNVLCLHGCCQTASMFSKLMSNLEKMTIQTATADVASPPPPNFHYMEAEFDHPRAGKTWYSVPLDLADIGVANCDKQVVAPTLDRVCQEIAKHNITHLLGFSQGANVVDTLMAMYPELACRIEDPAQASRDGRVGSAQRADQPPELAAKNGGPIHGVVLFSGYTYADYAHEPLVDCDALLVISETDDIVKPCYTPTRYSNSVVLKHDKGHKLPTSKPLLRTIAEFLIAPSTSN